MNLIKKNAVAIFLILLTLVLSSIPKWAGYSAETEGLIFKGAFFDPQDYAVHISMIRAGMLGDWSYQFRFTTEPHRAAYTRLFYVILGQFNRIIRAEPEALFEMTRWIFGFTALAALFALIKRAFRESFWQRIAFLLAVFGSGLGWIQLILGWVPGPITPIDFWLIDAYVFFGIALFPHFSFVTATLCIVLVLYFDFIEQGGWHRIALIAGFSILTQFVNPIAFVLVDTTIIVMTFASWVNKRKVVMTQAIALGIMGLSQIPLLVYNVHLLTFDPVWSQFTAQNETLSPPAIYYAWGFGLLWIFTVAGLVFTLREKNAVFFGMLAWIIIGFILAYAPFAIQRRFLHGITIPLALLSAQGLKHGARFIEGKLPFLARQAQGVVVLLALLTTISALSLSLGRSVFLQNHPGEFFYPASLDPAFEWLKQNTTPDDFILASAPSGLLIAQKTNLRVYLGHRMETLNYTSKLSLVDSYYKGNASPSWLAETTAQWILLGPYEQALSGGKEIQTEGVEIAYESDDVRIYRVNP